MQNKLYYSKLKTKVGIIYLLSNGKQLLQLDFSTNVNYEKAELNNKLPLFLKVNLQLEEYFNNKRTKFNLPLAPIGTEFQQLAWRTLLEIPHGKVLSYGEQALKMQKPKAQRATGSANGKNPIPIIIPCHRVITSDKKLGGYSGDIKLKEKLLKLEGHHFIDGRIKL
jgi:methylated-DNA-[protein]-cysteine S-methyltransferase